MATEKTTKKHYYYGLGRRKTAVATVHLQKGDGAILINGKDAGEYFNNQVLLEAIKQPLVLTGQNGKMDIIARVSGGGKRGQVDAVILSVSRALNELSEDFHTTLKKSGMLTRDPREKERKKYGLKKARKAPQFSKR
ncbi:30S ribosomal protein S9 [bacterium]|nr:30S ribosomal protein S9 [bacterium]